MNEPPVPPGYPVTPRTRSRRQPADMTATVVKARKGPVGRGELLAGGSQPRIRGRFGWDETGLWKVERSKKKPDRLIADWGDVVALSVSGSEAQAFSTHGTSRKSFTVRHTSSTATTKAKAQAFVVVSTKKDELILRLNASPMRVRAWLGPMIAKFREQV